MLVSTNEADGARGGELHAGLAQSVSGREVVSGVHLNRNNTLTSLHAGCGADVLSEGTSHTLRNTVCTCTGGLLVLSEDVVWEGVDSQSVALGPRFLSDGGVGHNTSGLKSRVANLHIVVCPELDHNIELAGLCRTAVTDVELVNSVVGHTTDVLSASIGWTLQTAVHDCWFTCHRYASKHPCDRCSLYHISAR